MSSMRCSALSDGEFVEGLRARRLERVEQAEARRQQDSEVETKL
jgi:hypothetical protein